VREKLIQSFQELADSVVAFIPTLAVGLGLFILGLIVAKIIEKVLRLILTRMHFDNLVGRAGIDKMLQKIGLRQEISHFIPRLVYFLVLLLMARTLADVLEWVAVSNALAAFFAYMPNLAAALILLVLGTAAGQFAGTMVTQAAESSGIEFAPTLGRVVSSLIMFIIGIMALTQLQIDTEMIRLVTSFLMAGAAIAFGLSFGLGARDVTRHVIAGFYAKKILQVGETLEIGGQQGVLTSITATHTILESGDQRVTISNGRFLDEIAKQ